MNPYLSCETSSNCARCFHTTPPLGLLFPNLSRYFAWSTCLSLIARPQKFSKLCFVFVETLLPQKNEKTLICFGKGK
eukprot:UN09618